MSQATNCPTYMTKIQGVNNRNDNNNNHAETFVCVNTCIKLSDAVFFDDLPTATSIRISRNSLKQHTGGSIDKNYINEQE